jgi:hypothetical protein
LEFLVAVAVSEKTVVTDVHESTRQNVEKEPSQKLHSVQSHGAMTATPGVVLPEECNLAVFKGDEPLIGDSHAMGIAGKVLEHLLGAAEGRLSMDNPIFVPYGLEPGLPNFGMLEVAKSSVKAKLAVLPGSLELGEELAAEKPAQYALGQKKTIATAQPAFAVGAQTTARDDHVQVGMNVKVFSPSVQEYHTADFCTQVFRVSTERQ